MADDKDYLQQQIDIATLVNCLIEGGHTQNGPLLEYYEASRKTGIAGLRFFHACLYLFDGRDGKRFIEVSGENMHGTESENRALERNPRKWEASLRMTEAGMALAKEELSVQHLFRQLRDYDSIQSRSRKSFNMSIIALCISGVALIVALGRLWLDSHQRSHDPIPEHVSISPPRTLQGLEAMDDYVPTPGETVCPTIPMLSDTVVSDTPHSFQRSLPSGSK